MTGEFRTYLAMQASWHRKQLQKWRDRRRRRLQGLSEFPTVEEVLAAPCCFVLSTGRCGTAFLTEVLGRSEKLSVHHAPKPELEYLSSLVHRMPPEPAALDLAALAARFELLLDTYRSGAVYVETNNRITFFAPALARLLPNARFVHVVRNPADFVRSGMRRGYYAEGVVQHQRLIPVGHPEWSSYSELEKIAWEWNEINGFIEKFKASVPEQQVLTLRSEALFREPEAMVSLLEFLGVGDEALVREVRRGRFEPVNQQMKGNFPNFEQWPEDDKAALRRLATLAPAYGYECS